MAVLAAVAWVGRQRLSLPIRGAVLSWEPVIHALAFAYDLALLALPLGWLWEQGHWRGRWPGELLLLWFGWLMPYVNDVVESSQYLQRETPSCPVILLCSSCSPW